MLLMCEHNEYVVKKIPLYFSILSWLIIDNDREVIVVILFWLCLGTQSKNNDNA